MDEIDTFRKCDIFLNDKQNKNMATFAQWKTNRHHRSKNEPWKTNKRKKLRSRYLSSAGTISTHVPRIPRYLISLWKPDTGKNVISHRLTSLKINVCYKKCLARFHGEY